MDIHKTGTGGGGVVVYNEQKVKISNNDNHVNGTGTRRNENESISTLKSLLSSQKPASWQWHHSLFEEDGKFLKDYLKKTANVIRWHLNNWKDCLKSMETLRSLLASPQHHLSIMAYVEDLTRALEWAMRDTLYETIDPLLGFQVFREGCLTVAYLARQLRESCLNSLKPLLYFLFSFVGSEAVPKLFSLAAEDTLIVIFEEVHNEQLVLMLEAQLNLQLMKEGVVKAPKVFWEIVKVIFSKWTKEEIKKQVEVISELVIKAL